MSKKKISFDVLNRALTKPGFLRIIREFDIKNVNHLVYEELRGEMKVKLEELISQLDILLKYKQKIFVCFYVCIRTRMSKYSHA